MQVDCLEIVNCADGSGRFAKHAKIYTTKKIRSDAAVPYAVIKGKPLSLLCYNKNVKEIHKI